VRTALAVGAALLGAALLVGPAAAQDVAAGRKVAVAICQTCHGVDGIAKQPQVPNLAGDDADYLTEQLRAFRSGARQNELMSAVIGMLDDKKIADVAAYYHAIEVKVVSMPGGG